MFWHWSALCQTWFLRVSPFLEQKLMTDKTFVDLSGLEHGLTVELRLTRRPAIWLHIKEVLS
jgi:hypothetical protein